MTDITAMTSELTTAEVVAMLREAPPRGHGSPFISDSTFPWRER